MSHFVWQNDKKKTKKKMVVRGYISSISIEWFHSLERTWQQQQKRQNKYYISLAMISMTLFPILFIACDSTFWTLFLFLLLVYCDDIQWQRAGMMVHRKRENDFLSRAWRLFISMLTFCCHSEKSSIKCKREIRPTRIPQNLCGEIFMFHVLLPA